MELPTAALSTFHPLYDSDPTDDPPEVEPIEHAIRSIVAKHGLINPRYLLHEYSPYNNGPNSEDPWTNMPGRPAPLYEIERTIQAHLRRDMEIIENWDNDSTISKAPTYLEHALRDCRDQPNPEECVETEQNNRAYWYNNMAWTNIYALFKRNSSFGSLIPFDKIPHRALDFDEMVGKHKNWFEGALLVENESDKTAAASRYGIPEQHVYHESDFADESKGSALARPAEYIDDYPIPVVIGHYNSGSDYVFIPWTGGLTCQCHYKQEKPYRVLCKHELFASMVAGEMDSEYLPIQDGIDIPDRARRLYDPLAVQNG